MGAEGQPGCGLTAAEVLQLACAKLDAAEIAESRLKAETLLARAMGCRRLELPLCRDRVVEDTAHAGLQRGVDRLLGGEPLQYILGDVEFMGHLFMVDKRVLIPRPETEELVETVLRCAEIWSQPSTRVVDVGTGSGCIAVSLALARPEAEIFATDIHAEALQVARENARRLGVEGRMRFVHCDLLAAIESESAQVVVSNPPYVSTAEWRQLTREIKDFEPRAALDGGEDGLCLISRLVPEAVRTLKSGGWLFMETGESQADRVMDQLAQSGFSAITVRKDLAGHNRIVEGRKA